MMQRLLLLLLLLSWTSTAWAHAPHDVVDLVELSPQFTSDETVFALVLLSDHRLLARSTDGGRSWLEYGDTVLAADIRQLRLSPTFASDGTLFAATHKGGIWRSTDFGMNWMPVNTGLTSLKTHDVALSPDFAADRTVLAATESGLFRSIDSGGTWTQVTSGLFDIRFTAVSFVPGDADTVFAGGYNLHRSSDAGLTWNHKEVFAHELKTIAVSPAFQTDSAMAVIFRDAQGVQASINEGVTWTPATQGLTDFEVNDLAIANDGTVFAVTSTDGCFRANAVLLPWTPVNEGFEELSDQTDVHYRAVAVSPRFNLDGKVCVGSFEGFFSSMDRGDTWKQSDLYNQRLFRRIAPSPDFADDGLLFAGNFGGGPYLWEGAGGSQGAPGGAIPGHAQGPEGSMVAGRPPKAGSVPELVTPWEALGNTTSSLYTSLCIPSPDFKNDRTLFYGYMGLWRSTDAGMSWERITIPVEIPREIAFSPNFATDRTLFMGSGKEGTFFSLDGADTWTEISGGLPPDIRASHIRLSPDFPDDPMLFIASTNHGVWRSPDAGATWVEINSGLPTTAVKAFALSPDFASDGLLLAGTVDNGLHRSDDRGDTWTAVNTGLPSGPINLIDSLAFSPGFAADRTAFAVSLYDGVYKSLDGAWTWQPIQGGLPQDAKRLIAVSPDYAQDEILFLSTHDWIWQSRDGGSSWHRLPGYNRVDDRHPTAVTQGEWSHQSSSGSFAAFVTASRESDASSELEFYGSSIRWYAVKDGESGMAEIVLDGLPQSTVDLFNPSPLMEQAIFSRTFGTRGWHTLRIRVTGTKNAASSDVWVKSDGFAVTF